jgi:hypothetical protein
MRKAAAVLLAGLLSAPPVSLGSAPVLGTIQGVVTLDGRPLSGVAVAFIDLQSGNVVRATTGSNGAFETSAAAGQYAVTTEGRAGLVVGRAPVRVAVVPGRVASAEIELFAQSTAMLQEPPQKPAPTTTTPDIPAARPQQPPTSTAPSTGAGASINFDPVTCFVAGEFPLLDAGIEPLSSVARARTYFKAAQGSNFYYVEMTQEAGRFFGKLPRPKIEASPLTYYLQATTTEFEESQTPEIEAIVVEKKEDCGDRKIAAYGPPGEVTVFSAATGASIAPLGFAAGGAAIALGTILLIVGGAAAAGITTAVVANPQATPPPAASPTPTAIPVAIPTPIPTPTPITTFR